MAAKQLPRRYRGGGFLLACEISLKKDGCALVAVIFSIAAFELRACSCT
jgi:hypothetical protein